MPACRNDILALCGENALQDGRNAGLLLARYLKEKQDGNTAGNNAREAILKTAVDVVGKSRDLYEPAFKRRGEVLGGTSGTFTITNGRMIVGLGGSNVLETGITLNHIYGTPLIPGSALKGLAAHYCADVWKNDPKFSRGGEYYNFMFGATEDAGFLTFHDAWLNPSSLPGSLVRDVMTPHHSKYYEGKGADPTDFDDPNPVTFLSVKGEFEIRVSCEGEGEAEERKAWESIAMRLLKQALKERGIGGKTSSGYGIGVLKYGGDSTSKQEKSSSVSPADAAAAPTRTFTIGQRVEAVFGGKNKKGNLQIEVNLNAAMVKARWDGDFPDVPKGTRIQATVKSYDPTQNPPLILEPSQ